LATLLKQQSLGTKHCKNHLFPLFYMSVTLSLVASLFLINLYICCLVLLLCCLVSVSSFIVVLVVSVIWDLSGTITNKCLCFCWVLFCCLRHSQRPNRLLTFLRGLNRLHTDQIVHFNIRTSLLLGKILLFTLYKVPKYKKDTYEHF